jgi:hypothetical protein
VGSNIVFYVGLVFFVCFRYKEEYCWAYGRYIFFGFFGSIENTIAPKNLSGEEA